MTKAGKIEALLGEGWPVAAIAEAVGCSRDYVRAVKSRLKLTGSPTGSTDNDRRYRRQRYWGDAEYRARCRAAVSQYHKHRYWSDAEYRERRREACAKANRERYARDPEYRESRKVYDRARKAARRRQDAGAGAEARA